MTDYMRFLFSLRGRVSRKDMWLKYLFAGFIALSVGTTLDSSLGLVDNGFFANIALLFFAWPSIAVSAKRFHDRGMSGWWALSIVVSLVFAVAFLVWAYTTTVNLDAELFVVILYIVLLAPIVFTFVVNYCLAGHAGPNKYGPDPLDTFGDPADAFD